MSKKQSTLFQSWGQKKKEPNETKKESGQRRNQLHACNGVIDLCLDEDDEDDDLLAQALEASIIDAGHTENVKSQTNNPGPSTSSAADDDVCNISIGAETFSSTQASSTQTKFPDGFDKFAGKLWIYPTNYPVREYQYSIVKQSLFNNTMVTLPTGLGKTFIASVVMYNFYRWYPLGKVVFMAPTKPLVAQQIEACYNIMGIPQIDTAEMTGNMPPQERRKAWNDKRVFFLTPQVLTNDLSRGTCPAVLVKCLVVDEAHKATGNHAYCQVVRELVKYTQEFRILALSATPGSDIKAVQQVLGNLLISHIEIRTEESSDIKQYSHERKVEKIVVPLGDELTLVKTKYLQIMDVVVGRLKRQGVIYNRDTKSLSKFLILKAREAFRQNPPERVQRSQFGMIEGDFALAMSLFHGYELLQLHGLRSLYNFLDGIVSGDKGHGRTRTELMKNADFNSLMEMLQEKFLPAECRPSQATEENKGRATRIMIFSQYRDSVTEIKDMLKQHYPIVKVMSFIGQSSAGKATKGFTQKEQLKVMKEFRDGGYNTLVSTCVGEEGLDIGEVDLIICFDAHKSPIRLVQRMGRTGRKREGRIVMLVTQGKEEQIYNQSQYSKKSIHKAILNGAKSLNFYQFSHRMVPDGWDPQCHKMFITVKETFKPTKVDEKNKITKMLNTNTESLDPNEDNYGQEMELFLNEDDIIKPGEGMQNDGSKITNSEEEDMLNFKGRQLRKATAFNNLKSTKKLQENKIVDKELEQDDNKKKAKGKKKDKKKKFSNGNVSIVQIIASDDGSDFDDGNNNRSIPAVPVEVDTGDQKWIKNNVKQQIGDNIDMLEPMSADDNNDIDEKQMDIGDSDNGHVNDLTFSQLFPVFENNKSVFGKSPNRNRVCITEYQFPSPPSVKEIKVVFESLGNSGHLPKIDLEELVEEWKKEKHFIKKDRWSDQITPAGLEQAQPKNSKNNNNLKKDADHISNTPLVDKNNSKS
ncbi:hypothetical protein KUTeg_013201 [Tegillarca granosa]|uniref:Uncharacterized protein n=1 Tax=Tegillarca granosa TaxID=220873 RepID=A0ABQ9EWG7_TEGGR|nr:hypothetical protein KUTeg_013201 [Tegillarca granosa]